MRKEVRNWVFLRPVNQDTILGKKKGKKEGKDETQDEVVFKQLFCPEADRTGQLLLPSCQTLQSAGAVTGTVWASRESGSLGQTFHRIKPTLTEFQTLLLASSHTDHPGFRVKPQFDRRSPKITGSWGQCNVNGNYAVRNLKCLEGTDPGWGKKERNSIKWINSKCKQ